MFIFPMVGRSSRFFNAGYTLPKYQLPFLDGSVFEYVLRSFFHYFESDEFLFICRSDYNAHDFVDHTLSRLGVKRYQIVVLEQDTRGQAETVFKGLQQTSFDSEMYIFNIDTFRPGFRKSTCAGVADGYLEVFKAPGDHWSFVLPGHDNRVVQTSEKVRISDLCSNGLYYFRSKALFEETYLAHVADFTSPDAPEIYVAPMYNHLIKQDRPIFYEVIDNQDVVLCGTPTEYESSRKACSKEQFR